MGESNLSKAPDDHSSGCRRLVQQKLPPGRYQREQTPLLGGVSSYEGLVHSAVLRDLGRLESVLGTGRLMQPERRQALAHHVVWMAAFLTDNEPERQQLVSAAQSFHQSGAAALHDKMLTVVSRVHEELRTGSVGVDHRRLGQLGAHVYWLCDGMPPPAVEHVVRLLAPRETPARRKVLSAVYAYRRALMWGETGASSSKESVAASRHATC
jgi:hypothetical protein